MPFGNGNMIPTFKSAFHSPEDEYNSDLGIRPVVFDILAPDRETSILPEGFRMVLHVNPRTMTVNSQKIISRIQTRGGYVEQHWGEGTRTIDFNMATGGFMRMYSGMSNVTGGTGSYDAGGTRRETIAYDKFMDLLALFHQNGGIYDTTGRLVFQGVIQMTFDGGIYLGYFTNMSVTESTDKPYAFEVTTQFLVDKEVQRFRSAPYTGKFPGFTNPDHATTTQETFQDITGASDATTRFFVGDEDG